MHKSKSLILLTNFRMKNICKYGNISIVLKFLFCTFAAEYKIKMPMER